MRHPKHPEPPQGDGSSHGDDNPLEPLDVPEPSPLTVAGQAPAPSAASLLARVDSDQLMRDLVERLLGGLPSYTPGQVSSAAGVEREVSKKLWRAMGLADVPDEEVAFTDLDVKALERTKSLLGHEEIQIHLIVQLARSMGLATARIADSIVDFTLERLLADLGAEAAAGSGASSGSGSGSDSGSGSSGSGSGSGSSGSGSSGSGSGSGEECRVAVPADELPVVSLLLEELDSLVVYLLHRHLVDATARRLATVGEGATSSQLMVGFADLVGYTALSQELPDEEIVSLVDRFEALAANEVVGAGGRIIKTIGDEVMFSASDATGPEIALRLSEAFDDPQQPKVRVGLASGPVLSRSGDLYGPVVNLAARATAIAHPGTVVVAPSVRDLLDGDERYTFRRLRPRRLKGIGFVELSALRRS